MNYYLIPPFASFTVLTILGLVSIKVSKDKKTLLFSFICFLGALHNLDKAILVKITYPKTALLVSRIDHTFFVFIIPVYVHFVYAFLGKKEGKLIKFLYLFSAALSPLAHTNYYFKGIKRFFFGYFAQGGPLLFLFFTVSFLTFIYSISLLFSALRTSKDKVERERIKFIIIGLGIASFLSHGDILLTKGVTYYPLGNFSFIPIFFLFYGLFKYDILDIGEMVRKALIYVFFIASIALLYFASSFFLNHIFLSNAINPTVSALFVTIVVVVAMDPLKGSLMDLVDKVFFRGRFLFTRVLDELLSNLSTELNPERIKTKLEDTLKAIFQPDGMEIRILEGIDEISEGNYEYEKHILFQDETLGFIGLGRKRGIYPYTPEERKFLNALSDQLAVVFRNAKSYRELREIKENLERIVEERTERIKRLMSEREKQYQMILQTEALASIGRLAAGVAHEINNPITTVKSMIQLAVEEFSVGRISEETLDDLRFSLKELDRIQELIRSLLSVSRVGVSKDESCDIVGAVRDSLRVLGSQIKKKGIRIHEDLPNRKIYVVGSSPSISQVFVNIISNAIDASEVGGKVEIGLEEGERVSVFVKDYGKGIPEDIRGKVFSPFFTTKPPGSGTGLGLYISSEIAKSLGGRIYFSSEEGIGTTFYVELLKFQ